MVYQTIAIVSNIFHIITICARVKACFFLVDGHPKMKIQAGWAHLDSWTDGHPQYGYPIQLLPIAHESSTLWKFNRLRT